MVSAVVADRPRLPALPKPAGPYRLGGWCMGGVVAYEMARQLQEDGERVGTLALIDSSFADGS